jgi:hypothetical protein
MLMDIVAIWICLAPVPIMFVVPHITMAAESPANANTGNIIHRLVRQIRGRDCCIRFLDCCFLECHLVVMKWKQTLINGQPSHIHGMVGCLKNASNQGITHQYITITITIWIIIICHLLGLCRSGTPRILILTSGSHVEVEKSILKLILVS